MPTNELGTRWKTPDSSEERTAGVLKLKEQTKDYYDLSQPMIEYLYNKGMRTLEDVQDLIDISVDLERSPFDLKDIEKAAEIISNHIDNDSHIIVFGDYDTDGITGTTIVVRALRHLQANAEYFVNHRFKHGFGISKLAVEDMIKEKGVPDLIITVDNGIVGYEGIQYAVEQGIEVVVTDHHIAEEKLPNASAVVNPVRLDDTSEFKQISGATVAYKVMLALYHHRQLPFGYIYDMRDLVALGTVGDVMPIIDENRWFVTQGLDLIGREKRPQFGALRRAKQGDKPFDLDADLFGFLLSPMMNAPSRLTGSPNICIDFFLTDSIPQMEMMAQRIVEINEERKTVTKEQMEKAEALVDVDDGNVIVAYHPEFHQGIIGLIAGRMTNKYNKPAVIFAKGPDGIYKGSSRSIETYNIKEALDRVSEHIVGHGGHAQAAGLSVREEDFVAFREALIADAEQLTAEDMSPVVHVDALLNPEDVTQQLVREINLFSPYGEGFRKPSFGLNTMVVSKVQYMTEGLHAKVIGNNGLTVLLFSGGDLVRSFGDFSVVHAVGSPSLNNFRGRTSVQFIAENNQLIGR